MPSKEDYRKNQCEVKYFTWQDIIFHKDSYRIHPDKMIYSRKIDGPTEILKNIDVAHFTEKDMPPFFKAYVHTRTGKVIEDLSVDLKRISAVVIHHVESKMTVTGIDKKPISSKTEVNLSETKPASCQYIEAHFSSNPYILWLSKVVLGNGHAIALWENNNDVPEESILFVTKSKIHTYAIWENINVDRACNVFKHQDANTMQIKMSGNRWTLYADLGSTNVSSCSIEN